MKYRAVINGEPSGSANEFERILRAARKAALTFPNPENALIHISIWEEHEDSELDKIVHHDLILPEDLQTIDFKDTREFGRTDLTKQTKLDIKKVKDTRAYYNLGDYVLVDDELYTITLVNDARAVAEPVRRKKVTIQDKLTDKKSTF